MTVNLMRAHREWANRPADERFWSVQDLILHQRRIESRSRALLVDYNNVEVIDQGEDLALIIPGASSAATFSNWSFSQFARKAGAPADYLSKLPARLARECLNEGLARRGDDTGMFLVSEDDGAVTLRASLSEEFGAVKSSELALRAQELIDRGWSIPPARPCGNGDPRVRIATEDDVSRYASRSVLSIKVGDAISPAGVYASDRDMFLIMNDESRPVHNPADPTRPLFRGLMLWNSDVGARSFGMTAFLYDVICGNHIVWGAQNVIEFRTYHRGSDAERRAFQRLAVVAMEYSASSASELETAIAGSQQRLIASNVEEIPDLIMAKKQLAPVLSKRIIRDAVEVAATSGRYGDPRSPWGVAQGLTELSQKLPNTNDRHEIDRAAGKILDLF